MGVLGLSGVLEVCVLFSHPSTHGIAGSSTTHTQSSVFLGWVFGTLLSVVCLPSVLFFIFLITEGVVHHSWNVLTTYTSSLLKCLFSLPPILKKRALCFIIKLTGSLYNFWIQLITFLPDFASFLK